MMRLFLLLISLIITQPALGALIDHWPADRIEKLTYEITTHMPKETKNSLYVEIRRTNDSLPAFVMTQHLTIPLQSLEIYSVEKYDARSLQLLSSQNHFKIPDKAKEELGLDSVLVKAQPRDDSLVVTSNSFIAPAGRIPFSSDLITTSGALLVSRNMDFEVGRSVSYQYINLLKLGSSEIKPVNATDSVIGVQTISTPAGRFECFKVKNTVAGGTYGYSYYTKEQPHLPVRTELVDPQSGNISMSIILLKSE
jgi:hypothetical protein